MVTEVWQEVVAWVVCGVAIAVAIVWLYRRLVCSKNRCSDCDKEGCPLHGKQYREDEKE